MTIKRTRTKKAAGASAPPAAPIESRLDRTPRRRRHHGFLIYEDGEKCSHCGYAHRQTKEDAANGDPAGFYLECPQCYREGCEECMPAGRGCVCPECEEGTEPR